MSGSSVAVMMAAGQVFVGDMQAGVSGGFGGFIQSSSLGSLTPAAFQGGTINRWAGDTGGSQDKLVIGGLSADPGQLCFTIASVGNNQQIASAATYSYSAGTATWIWAPGNLGVNLINGTHYPAILS
jgi:hypothetical protein